MNKIVYAIFFISFFSLAQTRERDTGLNLYLKAENLFSKKSYDSSYISAKSSLKIFNQLKNDSLIVESNLLLVKITSKINKEEQEKYFQTALTTSKKNKDWDLVTKVFYTKGKAYYNDRNFSEAIPYYLKVDSLTQYYALKNVFVVRSLMDRSEISRLNFTEQTAEDAEKLINEALVLAKEIVSDELINDIYLRLADLNGFKGALDETKRYLDLAYLYYTKVDHPDRANWMYMTYANYYYELKDYDNAEKKITEGISYMRTKRDSELLADLLVLYGNFFRNRRQNCVKAIPQFEEAKALYNSIDLKESIQYLYMLEGMAVCYAEIGDYKSSSNYYKQTYQAKKTMEKKQNSELTRNLENKYQAEKKEQEITLLNSEKELVLQQKKNQRNLLLAGLTITTLIGLFFFYQYQNRQKTNKKLQELDKAKSTFFANISHEFRTPLTLIKGPIEDQLNSTSLSQADRKNLQLAKTNSQRLESLVEQLLAISKLESGNLKLRVQPGNLSQFISAHVEAFSFSAKEKQINLELKNEDVTQMAWFDRDAIGKILFNLLGNAIKYTPENGKVNLVTNSKNGFFKIIVSNTGSYLSDEEQQKVFTRFYQTNSNNPGTGIGLALTKELIELHKGIISVTSEKDGFTVFKIEFPIDKSSYNSQEILSELLHEDKMDPFYNDTIVEDTIIQPHDVPLLLIVEDNEELKGYIKSIFEGEYEIHTAKSGKEGVEMAFKYIPDIIISDVMMPVEDGFTLTKKLKENQLTSHIPIVLLTAKSEDKDKLKGIETGAEAYITKPFGSQILKATLSNLIETRRKLQKRFSQEVILKPKEVAISSAEEEFLEKLQKILDTRIVNPEFSADVFSKEMLMSRMQLHRKLKAITGQTTSEFLRSQRLAIALQFLKQKVSISEIAYAVGFNDPSYFAKCFKEEFGCAPSEYNL